MTATSEPLKAYSTLDFVEARALAARLSDAGIDAHVLGEALQGAYAGIHIGGMNASEVWIATADREQAEAVIAEWLSERQQRGTEGGKGSADAARPEPSLKLQFSVAALLWLLTIVAILSAATALDLIELSEWLPWMFIALMVVAFIKACRRLYR